ncbi:MAG: sialate O-acetylesterase [Mucilaginibacter sp.]|uniref:sialate O-acetylesterase n=1 Tax=Mucilaginibacter sp. TaxID=1882438 RepID=UPI0032663281
MHKVLITAQRLMAASALILFSTEGSSAKVILPDMLSSNMVLQQKAQTRLWGKAAVNKTVMIITSWNKKKYSAKADANGDWKIKISTPVAGGPYTIDLSDGELLTLNNILIGEVWMCSGQSNMEMPLAGWGKVNNYEQEVANANYPEIRLLQVKRIPSSFPLTEANVTDGGWQPCSPQSVPDFSSVAYFFARKIYQEKHIPIGLINSTWGGTVAEAWTGGESLKTMSDFATATTKIEHLPHDPALQRQQFQQQSAKFDSIRISKDAGYKNGKPYFTRPDIDVSDWKIMNLPTYWEVAGLPDFDGIVWFRKKITIPQTWVGHDITLNLGTINDDDVTFFNGTEVGKTNGWSKVRTYAIPAALVKEGDNTIVVRVNDGNGSGGIYGKPEGMFAAYAAEKIDLSGQWVYKVGVSKSELPEGPTPIDGPNRTTVLYNAMINPFTQIAIKGVIWYQGETNSDRAYQYRTLFPLLITDWRKRWGIGDFPFYFVQLANWTPSKITPAESAWAELREAQLKTLALPNTGMAVTVDVGDEKNIHYKNKQEVGRRLALVALAKSYGDTTEYSGPLFKAAQVEANQVRISFSHGNGLKAANGDLKGFAIAGNDKKYYWATAKIENNQVVVSAPEVPQPLFVRYAWDTNPVCNLYNASGLPASPFRTDDFPAITFGKR